MNVKFMSHFSTTNDAVVFPGQMKNISRTESINGKEYMKLEDVMINAGLYNGEIYCAFNSDWIVKTHEIQGADPDERIADVAGSDILPIREGDGLIAIAPEEIGEYWLSTDEAGTLLKGDKVVMENFAGIKRVE
jgi:hypothetical protein